MSKYSYNKGENMEEINIEKVKKIKKTMPSDDLLFDIAEVFKVFGDTTRMKIIMCRRYCRNHKFYAISNFTSIESFKTS